jgi:putative hydrolase
MSDDGPLGGGDPFGAMPFFGDLFRMMSSSPSNTWESARQLAVTLASEGVSEPNVDPSLRIALEQLGRVADLHVSDVSGLSTVVGGRSPEIAAVTRGQWAQRSLDAYRPLLERLSASLTTNQAPLPPELASDPAAAMFGPMLQAMGPMLLAMTAGSMVGQLATHSLGGYDLPIPRGSHELLIAVHNVDRFADEWSLPIDELRLWVCIHELAHHAVLGVPHIGETLRDLLDAYAAGFRPDPTALLDRVGDLDPASGMEGLAALQEQLTDPDVVLGVVQSPQQRAMLPNLEALVAVVVGVVDHTMDTIGTSLMPAYWRITEAFRRHRVEADRADRFVERILGLNLTQAQYDRGSAFVSGVIERAGDAGLARLWADVMHLPTPAEVDAPGLWLARIDLPGDA